jgi:signal transduction histidine kinase/CheY-like chemotaxis protein
VDQGSGITSRIRGVLFEIGPGIVFAFLPLAFLAIVTLFELSFVGPDAKDARIRTLQSFEILRDVADIDRAVQDAERSQRGYLITGRENYLAPYTNATSVLPTLVARLRRAASESPDQAQRALILQEHIEGKLSELASTIEAMRTRGPDAARAIVDTDAGRIAMENIQNDLAEITNSANETLKARVERSQLVDQRARQTFLLASVVSALALLLGGYLLSRAFQRAARSERILQATLDSVPEGIAAFDEFGRLRASNAQFAKLASGDGAPLKVGSTLTKDNRFPVATWIEDLRATFSHSGQPALVERTVANEAIFEVFYLPLSDGGYVASFLDVTERRRTEEAIRQGQKLESLGQMTGGVAHDFNNLLTIIVGSLTFLRRMSPFDKKAQERIDMIGVAAERGAKLTKQLLAFARKQPLTPEVVNLDQLVNEVLPLLRRAVSEAVTVEYEPAIGVWDTTIDPAQFQAAVLNLAINGRDAMPEGGKLSIEVANVTLDSEYGSRVTPGEYVKFAMTDVGQGMDTATASRALDPFFTTKPEGAGTGLGLSQVYGFVTQSGGHLKIDSRVGRGTTVEFFLPRASAEAAAPTRRSAAAPRAGFERILLVDDDETVRATVAAMLQELGYYVTSAPTGEAALSLLEQGLVVDMLLTDVVMPGSHGGRKLAEAASQIIPGIKILFTSGYAEGGEDGESKAGAEPDLIQKPFDRERLSAKIREIMDKAS